MKLLSFVLALVLSNLSTAAESPPLQAQELTAALPGTVDRKPNFIVIMVDDIERQCDEMHAKNCLFRGLRAV